MPFGSEVSRRFRRNILSGVLVRMRSNYLFFFYFLWFFLIFTRKFLGSFYSIKCFTFTSLSNIDFVPFCIITQFIFKWICINCMASRFTHYLDFMLFLKINNNIYLAFCNVHRISNICSYQLFLTEPWLRTEDFFEEIFRVNEIFSWSRGFVFKRFFLLNISRLCLLPEIDRNCVVICTVDFT